MCLYNYYFPASAVVTVRFLNESIEVEEPADISFCVQLIGIIERPVAYQVFTEELSDLAQEG